MQPEGREGVLRADADLFDAHPAVVDNVPVVRFDSSHYRYVLDADGPRIEQVGIGAQDTLSPLGLHFRPPAAPSPRALSADDGGRRH